jgi:hypothetical protein
MVERVAVVSVVLVLAVTLGASASAHASVPGAGLPPTLAAASLSDASWIEAVAQGDGAIPEGPGSLAINPYLANLAVRGLAAAVQLGDAAAARIGWAWCNWYASHQQPDGFITDYVLNGTKPVSTGSMDSTDAYAGTFLAAVRDLYAATGDRTTLNGMSTAVARAVAAIEATQDTDGMTWAKPQWHVKYLMDQAEAYDGLVAASELGVALGDPNLGQRAAGDASRIATGVAQLWNVGTDSYDWALDAGGARQTADWSVLYPDVMQEVWAVAYGLADAKQADLIMARLAVTHPEWQQPDAVAGPRGRQAQVGYWPVGAWALDREGQDSSAAVASMRAAAVPRVWPYTVAVAGELIVASSPPPPSLPVPVPWVAPRTLMAGQTTLRPAGHQL